MQPFTTPNSGRLFRFPCGRAKGASSCFGSRRASSATPFCAEAAASAAVSRRSASGAPRRGTAISSPLICSTRRLDRRLPRGLPSRTGRFVTRRARPFGRPKSLRERRARPSAVIHALGRPQPAGQGGRELVPAGGPQRDLESPRGEVYGRTRSTRGRKLPYREERPPAPVSTIRGEPGGDWSGLPPSYARGHGGLRGLRSVAPLQPVRTGPSGRSRPTVVRPPVRRRRSSRAKGRSSSGRANVDGPSRISRRAGNTARAFTEISARETPASSTLFRDGGPPPART